MRRARKSRHVGRAKKAPSPSANAPEWITVILRTPKGVIQTLTSSAQLQETAMNWAYVVRNRRRWSAGGSPQEALARGSVWALGELGIGKDTLLQCTEAGTVEVSIPYFREELGWEARILPWEYMLSAATKYYEREGPLTVVRHLDRRDTGRRATVRSPKSLLIVESAPGKLREQYSFEAEVRLVDSCLNLERLSLPADPTPAALELAVKQHAPDVIHVTGIDTHQGTAMLRWPRQPERPDGMFLSGDDGSPQLVDAAELARILNVGDTEPALVACNFYNSAARVAALIVAAGAGVAIGFQDTFDDEIAELFLTNFYRAWQRSDWNTLLAFQQAWNDLKVQPGEIHGTGVVLWSGRSVVETQPIVGLWERVSSLKSQLREADRKVIPSAEVERDSLLEVQVRPYRSLNYSLLHNSRGVFDVFRLRKLREGRINGVEVEVVLHVGNDNFPYRATFDLVDSIKDLSREINVPLTSTLARAVRESVHTSLFMQVKVGDSTIYRDTQRITLLPVDEWRDDDLDRLWLPSFVLPREPAVAHIIDAAQRYLMALADDGTSGFDGYQSLDAKASDRAAGVDLQVRAIWSALSYEFGLSYINPPPTYSQASQRLRTPSQIIDGHRGTCIDLALLLAACLEYVDIYPVVFLLQGHAFPGYWRSDDGHDHFQLALGESGVTTPGPSDGSVAGQREAWIMGQDFYQAVLQQLRNRELAPIETVLLTQRTGFWEAVDEGMKNLRSKNDFQAMVDIKLARLNQVTPLPISGDVQ